MTDDEKKYSKLISTLNNLQQVKAAPNFESDLRRKLNKEKSEKEEKKILRNYLIPSRLIPSFGLVVVAVIIILSIDINSDDNDNPFLMEPRVREDIIEYSDASEVELPEGNISSEGRDVEEDKIVTDKKDVKSKSERKAEEEALNENLIAGRELSVVETILTAEIDTDFTNESTSPPATGFAIRKSGLNFRQVNPTVLEQQEIQQLKEKVQKESKELDLK